MDIRRTQDASLDDGGEPRTLPLPAAILIFSGRRPVSRVLPIPYPGLVLGRQDDQDGVLSDPQMSRNHAEIRYDGTHFVVRDLGSRNGTFAHQEKLAPDTPRRDPRWLRLGNTLVLLEHDARPFLERGTGIVDGLVMGPSLHTTWEQIDRVARSGDTLFINGESGTGKELAARAFHASCAGSGGSFVAVNCSAIPSGMAERLLFGTVRGAYSGAVADAGGYVQAARGGTLFLDEVAELDLAVQAKLLRVLENREVLPLGAARPDKVELSVCCATHKDLRAEVAGGRFRQDLYFRVGRPVVRLPPLRERLEEIPWLVEQASAQRSVDEPGAEPESRLSIHPSLVVACLERPWPGNVRELLTEVRFACHRALAESAHYVHARHLDADAGTELAAPGHTARAPLERAATEDRRTGNQPDRATLERVLREHQGNVSAAARSLYLHRTQLRRLLARHDLDPRTFAPRDET